MHKEDLLIDVSAVQVVKELVAVPHLSFQTLLDILMWEYNASGDMALSLSDFTDAYGANLGNHYWEKYIYSFNRKVMEMVMYFRGEDDNGQKFVNMVIKKVLQYKSRQRNL